MSRTLADQIDRFDASFFGAKGEADGTVVAWGTNDYGQIGDGKFRYSATPVTPLFNGSPAAP